GAGLSANAMHNLEAMNTAAAGLCLDRTSAPAGEPDAAASGLDIHRAPDAADFNVSATGRSPQVATHVLHRDIATAGLKDRVAFRGFKINIAPAGSGGQLATH